MNTIEFNNQNFPVRELQIGNLGTILISIQSLNSVLTNDDGTYSSHNAIQVDNSIYFYVEDESINLEKKKLYNLILSELV